MSIDTAILLSVILLLYLFVAFITEDFTLMVAWWQERKRRKRLKKVVDKCK